MTQIITVGLDLAKNVFQVHAVDASLTCVVNKPLRRASPWRPGAGVFRPAGTLPPCLGGRKATSHQPRPR